MALMSRVLSRAVPKRFDRTLDAALDRALAVQRPAIVRYLDRVRTRKPHMTPAQVVTQLEKRYRAAVMGIGGASGAAAAVPGTGTAASLASGAAEVTAFVSATTLYVLALAELYGVPVNDPQARRALVLSVLVGETGASLMRGETEGTTHWAQVLGRTANKDKIAGVNSRLAHLFITRFGVKQGALMFGRALPLGVGAGIGAAGNGAVATATIKTARKAFGPPPRAFPPRIVER